MKNARQLQVRAYAVVVYWGHRLEAFKQGCQGKQLKIDHSQNLRALYVLVQRHARVSSYHTEHGISHTRIQSYGVLHNTPRACAIESVPEHCFRTRIPMIWVIQVALHLRKREKDSSMMLRHDFVQRSRQKCWVGPSHVLEHLILGIL
jgi:hypothetical protein